jgi:hypothetical protein
VSDITRIIIFGVPKNPIDLEQKGGRGGRSSDIHCLVLLIAEAWAYDGARAAKEAFPANAKVQRTENEIFVYVPLQTCRRLFLKTYNNDKTAEGGAALFLFNVFAVDFFMQLFPTQLCGVVIITMTISTSTHSFCSLYYPVLS